MHLKLFFLISLFSNFVWSQQLCPFVFQEIKLNSPTANDRLIVCADKEKSKTVPVEYLNHVEIFQVKDPLDLKTKPLVTLKEKNSQYLYVPSHTGVVIIETVNLVKDNNEIIRHQVVCEKLSCKVLEPVCLKLQKLTDSEKLALKKEKKYKKLSQRLKKMSCL